MNFRIEIVAPLEKDAMNVSEPKRQRQARCKARERPPHEAIFHPRRNAGHDVVSMELELPQPARVLPRGREAESLSGSQCDVPTYSVLKKLVTQSSEDSHDDHRTQPPVARLAVSS